MFWSDVAPLFKSEKQIYILPGGDPDVQLSECDQRSGVHFLHSFPRPSVQGNQLSVCDCSKTCWFMGLRHIRRMSADGDMRKRIMLKSPHLFVLSREGNFRFSVEECQN